MNINFDIPDDDIVYEATQKARKRIIEFASAMASGYEGEQLIKASIKKNWPVVLETIVKEELVKLPEIRVRIAADIEKRARAMVSAAMKSTE